MVIMRADNHGEGGILSLVALIQERFGSIEPWARSAVALGVLGAALFYCDALITPAISVFSAVEGMTVLDPAFEGAVIAGDAGGHRCAVRDPASRHRARRKVVWSHHGVVVRDARRARRHGDHQRAARARGPQSLVRLAHAGHASRTGAGDSRRGIPRGDWRGGAVCRHGPLRPRPVQPRVAGAGVAGTDHQLLRPGRAAVAGARGRWHILSTRSRRRRCCRSWCCCRPPRRSSLRRPPSPAPSRSRARPCSSICCRACAYCRPRPKSSRTDLRAGRQQFMLVAVVFFVIGFGSSSALSAAYGASVVGTMLITTLLGALVAKSNCGAGRGGASACCSGSCWRSTWPSSPAT